MVRLLLISMLIAHLCCGSVQAEDQPTPPVPESYPGLSEVFPRASALTEQINAAQQRLQQSAATAPLHSLLEEERQRYSSLQQQLASYGPVENWYFDRQMEVSSQLKSLDSALKGVQQRISNQLKASDQLHLELQTQKNYWHNWRKHLQASDVDLPRDIFKGVQEQIATTLKLAEKHNQPLVELQKRVLTIQEEVQEQIGLLETALKQLRKNLLQRSGHSMFHGAYWAQFTPELWQSAQQEARISLQVREDFYRQNALLIGLQILFSGAVTYLIYRYRSTIAQSNRWQILADHALATGLFASIAFLSFFYQGVPALFRLLLAGIGLLSAVQLSIGLLKNRVFSVYLYSFSLLALLTLALRLSGLPLPYYRAYLVFLCLSLLTFWLLLCRQLTAAEKPRGLSMLRLIGVLLLGSLITNLAGYVSLSFRLLESSLESVVVILFAALAYQIGLGGVAFLLSRISAGRSGIVARFGQDFQRRFERIFLLLLVGYSCLYLTAVWGLYSTPGKAWEALTGFSWSIANYQLSLAIILQVVLVFYLTLELSWLLQIILDRQLFDRRQYDRGVRDAVKKLLHYTLVLIGFLLAAGVAGFELRNFMVLAGAFGIGIGFGLQDIVNNFLSGIILLFERPIKVGDGVLVDGEYGTVLRIGLRSTVVETLDQAELIVPNSQLISQKLTNWTLSTRRVRVMIPVGVAYGSNLELVLKVLAAAGEQHPDVLAYPQPSPIFVQFGESSLDFELRVWISDVDKRPRVKSELLLYIDQRFRQAGVEIPFPQRDLHLRTVAPGSLFPDARASEHTDDP